MLQCTLPLQILRVLKASQINGHHNTGLWEWLLVGVVQTIAPLMLNTKELSPQQWWTFPHPYESEVGPDEFRLQCSSGWEVVEWVQWQLAERTWV